MSRHTRRVRARYSFAVAATALILLAGCRQRLLSGAGVDPDRVRAIEQAIAQLRGRPFGASAHVDVLDRDAMAATVMRLRERDENLHILRIRSIVDRAFGDPWTTDPIGAMRRLPADNAFAVYSPSDDTLFLSRARLESAATIDLREFVHGGQTLAELVVTHELAHAWQHRHFPALFAVTDDIDEWETQHALIEGDAEVTTLALMEHAVDDHALDTYQRLRQRMAAAAGQQPESNRDWQLRYAYTPRYLSRIVRERGWAGLNAFLDDPPRATAAILEPLAQAQLDSSGDQQFLCPAGWQYAADTRIGAFQIPPLLRMSPKTTLEMAGWRGDRLQICVRGDDLQWRWHTRWDSEAAATSFVAAVRAHLQRQHPQVTFGEGDSVRVSPVSWIERRGRVVSVADGRVATP